MEAVDPPVELQTHFKAHVGNKPEDRAITREWLAQAMAGTYIEVVEGFKAIKPKDPRKEPTEEKKASMTLPQSTPRNPNTLLMIDVLKVIGSNANLSEAMGAPCDWKIMVPARKTAQVRELMHYWPLIKKIRSNHDNGRTVEHFAEKYGYDIDYVQDLCDKFNVLKHIEVAHVV
jgi:hypothetical protein